MGYFCFKSGILRLINITEGVKHKNTSFVRKIDSENIPLQFLCVLMEINALKTTKKCTNIIKN